MSADYYESLIDGSDFGTISSYMEGDQPPLRFLLHVKERAHLARLAETVQHELEAGNFGKWGLPPSLMDLMRQGLLKFSEHDPWGVVRSAWQVRVKDVDAGARCDVIYLPPFYLVHTPGLFEGKCVSVDAKTRKQSRRYLAAKEYAENREGEIETLLEEMEEEKLRLDRNRERNRDRDRDRER